MYIPDRHIDTILNGQDEGKKQIARDMVGYLIRQTTN